MTALQVFRFYDHDEKSRQRQLMSSQVIIVDEGGAEEGSSMPALVEMGKDVAKGLSNSCGVDQNSSWSSGGQYLPPLVTHAKMVNMETKAELHALEHLLVRTEPACDDTYFDHRYADCLRPSFEVLSTTPAGCSKIKLFSGNAIPWVSAGAFLLYRLSNNEAVDKSASNGDVIEDTGMGFSG